MDLQKLSQEVRRSLESGGKKYDYYSLPAVEEKGFSVRRLPYSIRILLENALRNFDNFGITTEHLETLLNWQAAGSDKEIPYKPARVLMQDFTGVPAVVDLASLRSEMQRKGKDPKKINPLVPVDLVIDHSIQVEYFGTSYAFRRNVELEYERNKERYQLLKWAQKAFKNFSVVPPGMGICHQVNLEYLAKGVMEKDGVLFPDTLVGTDSHTPMVNGIGVLGWGVGGIEAEAALLGQPIYFLTPQVIGLKLTGELPAGTTATDLVLTITHLLRQFGVVGKFVEVFGDGLDKLTVPDRATISNMSPEFGCTVTFFPVDDRTLDYMALTGRPDEWIRVVEDYCKANALWRNAQDPVEYSHVLELDLGSVQPTVSGPKRPQDKILVKDLKESFKKLLKEEHQRDYIEPEERQENTWLNEGGSQTAFTDHPQHKPVGAEVAVEEVKNKQRTVRVRLNNEEYLLSDGAIVIAAITSCTNTSNPSVMLGAGLVAKKAIERGLDVKPWVKTSLAPGSKVVTDYLERSGLLEELEALRFHVVGYGCTSCIGNSGPLPAPIAEAIEKHNLITASVLSGNRNFEARVHPQVKMNFLASPMLVVAYAIAGRVDIDLLNEPLGYDPNLEPVYLKDIWPTQEEIFEVMKRVITPEDFRKNYGQIFEGDDLWQSLPAPSGEIYQWDENSTYIQEAPFFKNLPEKPEPIESLEGARVLLYLGDSVTTDHISPAGSFKPDSPAGKYLTAKGVQPKDFNSYGSRRGNHEVMMRGTFANVRIKNKLAKREGGYTTYLPTGEEMTVFDAAMKYQSDGTPLLVLAGKEYGSGSSRDWAAKGTYLLGIRAVIAESYERIHRSNLIGMGVLPLQFKAGESAASLGLDGTETFSIEGLNDNIKPQAVLRVKAQKSNGETIEFDVICRLDSEIEVEYYRHKGILNYVLRQFLQEA
ncbi:MAG: aconitate hydratase [Thermonema sp.]|uniref:aconitate hydratase n=1 Tax=Thermonema sp. TaxID=2231181 RepID=UPI0021DBBA5C|nr:aconitate hydratase [Thermonema sp.]GIV39337.1 MAG: aconitate hydratase [Thermonema sp.]